MAKLRLRNETFTLEIMPKIRYNVEDIVTTYKLVIMPIILYFILVFSLSFWLCRYFLLRPSLLSDIPNSRSLHSQIISRAGGLAFGLPSLIFLYMILWPSYNIALSALCLGATAMLILGLLDDYLSLSVRLRFFASLFFISFLCFNFLEDRFIFFLWEFSGIFVHIFQVLWVLAFINFFNFMDGMDGLAILQAIWISFWLCLTSFLDYYFFHTSLFSKYVFSAFFILGSALLGFLYWNRPPAKIFMGDAGSYFLGFIFAFITLILLQNSEGSANKGGLRLDFLVPILMSFPFLLDSSITLFLRLFKRKNIFEAHREHLYQKLKLAKWSTKKVLAFYQICNLSFSFLLLLRIFYEEKATIFWLFLLFLLGFFWLITFFLLHKKYKSEA